MTERKVIKDIKFSIYLIKTAVWHGNSMAASPSNESVTMKLVSAYPLALRWHVFVGAWSRCGFCWCVEPMRFLLVREADAVFLGAWIRCGFYWCVEPMRCG
ncbi:hypothetical protein RRG08_012920 [Elysia crispata]|uniref:Uncharacterized protein n=1 Tax=Elysia crispata TaxID=231223 RepID=A0AAE0ZZN5_9GAST|nr:hypothetical protein RRG08_012920 [Elysia crispata]